VIDLKTLGAVELRDAAGRELSSVLSQPKRLAVLLYLALARPRGFQRRDVLLALFWPEADHDHARAALRKVVHVLRRELGEGVLLGRGDEEVGFAQKTVRCDVVAFEEAIGDGRFTEALELYRGELLEGFFVSAAPEFERWVDGERVRLREQAAVAAWALADEAGSDEQGVPALNWARRALSLTPADEGALRRLITLAYRCGDRAAAMRAYSEFAARLAQEFGVRPSAETRQLIEVIKASGEIAVNLNAKWPLTAPPPKRHA
jgi:DNA-binding SARP family transcriptional activator